MTGRYTLNGPYRLLAASTEHRRLARRWVQAVNTRGGLGTWAHHICYDAGDLKADLLRLMQTIPVDEPVGAARS